MQIGVAYYANLYLARYYELFPNFFLYPLHVE